MTRSVCADMWWPAGWMTNPVKAEVVYLPGRAADQREPLLGDTLEPLSRVWVRLADVFEPLHEMCLLWSMYLEGR